ncbi:MAG: 2-oxoglutarate dehydrogenase E1 component [Opitutae bacterium]|nr:2-oxoglutarate dehydrogenase E1 component [Opitutae bacterium]
MKNLNFATQWNADLIESQFEVWQTDPGSLDLEWRAFFEGFELGRTTPAQITGPDNESIEHSVDPRKQARFTGAIYAYRSIGHTQATIDPLAKKTPDNPRLSMQRLGFDNADLGEVYDTGNYLGGQKLTVEQLLDNLQKTYCGNVGIEYLHIQATNKRRWLQSRIEPSLNQPDFNHDEKLQILRKLREAELFEHFLHTHYVGQKRFSLEGGETLIPCLDGIIQKCPEFGIDEIVMGMAHRGRLNVLANILEKSYEYIFEEFTDNYYRGAIHGDGDVKYHLGYNNVTTTLSGDKVEVRLAANPSHLEAVGPVVMGKTRARQRIRDDLERKKVLPILIHGDAAIAGQGVVAEVFNFSQLKGYHTGGAIHIVVNNQIGFTTNPEDSRSGQYCTDIAKMIEVPIFHVNGNDPLAVAMVSKLALTYRQEFGEDVVIDINCYRRHGHNEADEPGFTHPVLYRKIAETPLSSQVLVEQMIQDGDITPEAAEKLEKEYQDHLENLFQKQKNKKARKIPAERSKASSTYILPYSFKNVRTSVSKALLKKVTEAIVTVPDAFHINPKIRRQLDRKLSAFNKGKEIDWGLGEQLAYGTLLLEGTPVRLSGQDSERGTFSHRHAVYYDIDTRQRYVPLLDIEKDQAKFCVYNSSLSEAGILGFDFGYAQDYPDMLAIWEAQFGDFANGAQVIIDQFIASGESKWGQPSAIVMLLPHGYEGQGPEHSSARPERYLQLCAENNIQVCNLTTPAQLFHALRRQMKQKCKRPLVVFTPKSLLRHKRAVSSIKEFTSGSFQEILDDPNPPKDVRKLVLCAGKVYYDLLQKREEESINDTAIIRVEQFYPMNEALLQKVCGRYPDARITWCQEEPRNMGGWNFVAPIIGEVLGHRPIYVGRAPAASPATGSLALHRLEQRDLLEIAFT